MLALTPGVFIVPTDSGATWQQVPGQPTLCPTERHLRPMRCHSGPDGLLYVTYANSPGLSSIGNGAVYKLNTNNGNLDRYHAADTQN